MYSHQEDSPTPFILHSIAALIQSTLENQNKQESNKQKMEVKQN